jgi:ADP-ribosylglycohydrolase
MLLEMAVADAYGIAFEFVEPEVLELNGVRNTMARYYQNPNYAGVKPGQYTDDTQRALANCNIMCNHNEYDAEEYANEYLEILKRDPRDGYSRRYQKFLEETPNAIEFIRTITRGSANGALMGVAPLGYLRTPGEVILAAGIQAFTTHSMTTMPYACGVALAAHYFIHKIGPKACLTDYLHEHIPQLAGPYIRSAGVAQMSARATYYLMLDGIRDNTSLAGIIRWAVDQGGDTDSIAAATVAVASCSDEFQNDIPQVLRDGLENGTYGRDYLIQVDSELKRIFLA